MLLNREEELLNTVEQEKKKPRPDTSHHAYVSNMLNEAHEEDGGGSPYEEGDIGEIWDNEEDSELVLALRKVLAVRMTKPRSRASGGLDDVFDPEGKALVWQLVELLPRTMRESLQQILHSDMLTTFWLEKKPASTHEDPEVAQRTKLVDGLVVCPLSAQRHDAMIVEFSGGLFKKSNVKGAEDRVKLLQCMKRAINKVVRRSGVKPADLPKLRIYGVQVVEGIVKIYCMNVLAKRLYLVWKFGSVSIPKTPAQLLDESFGRGLIKLLKVKCDLIETTNFILSRERGASVDGDLSNLLSTPPEDITDFLSHVEASPTRKKNAKTQ